VIWQGMELGRGEGPSKKEAHFAAALDSLQRETWKMIRQAGENLPPITPE